MDHNEITSVKMISFKLTPNQLKSITLLPNGHNYNLPTAYLVFTAKLIF